jgi:hypothetical protein
VAAKEAMWREHGYGPWALLIDGECLALVARVQEDTEWHVVEESEVPRRVRVMSSQL